jgi:Chalcone isomerase-like
MRHLLAVLALSLAIPVLAKDVAGVAVPESATVGDRTLVLNGAGLRSRFFVKVYVGALYLEQRSADPAAIIAADQAWKVSMTFKREVEKKQILGAFKEGFENNSRADLDKLLPGLAQFDAVMKDLKTGDVLEIAYLPGTGSTVVGPGGVTATVEGKVFAAALLRNWLGEKPADGDLKSGMLGK